jgi:hypothetical protein
MTYSFELNIGLEATLHAGDVTGEAVLSEKSPLSALSFDADKVRWVILPHAIHYENLGIDLGHLALADSRFLPAVRRVIDGENDGKPIAFERGLWIRVAFNGPEGDTYSAWQAIRRLARSLNRRLWQDAIAIDGVGGGELVYNRRRPWAEGDWGRFNPRLFRTPAGEVNAPKQPAWWLDLAEKSPAHAARVAHYVRTQSHGVWGDDIWESFTFADTPEGHVYWVRVAEAIAEGGELPLLPELPTA